MRFVLGGIAIAALALAIGCEGDISTAPATDAGAAAAAPAPPAPLAPGAPEAAAPGTNDAPETHGTEALEEPQAEATMPDAGTTGPAQAGVGAKGRDYGGEGFVTTPVQTYFRTGERIAFEIQIPSAMKLDKAANNNKGPKTHEEFMEVIIRENGIGLPDLPPGEEFLYDPETEQLMVRRPAP